MNEAVNEVQESIKIALDAADAATDVTSEFSKIKQENKKLENSVKNIHKYTTIIFGVSILAAVIALSLTAMIYSRTMNELSAMTNTSREALVVFAENVEKVNITLEKLESGIENQSQILETNNALIETIKTLDANVVNTNNLVVTEISKLSENINGTLSIMNKNNNSSIGKVVKDLKSSQAASTKKLTSLANKATGNKVLKKISSNQEKMLRSFNDLAKAVNNLANQSGELAKSFKDSSYIKYP